MAVAASVCGSVEQIVQHEEPLLLGVNRSSPAAGWQAIERMQRDVDPLRAEVMGGEE